MTRLFSFRLLSGLSAIAAIVPAASASLSPELTAQLPKPAARTVDFARDIQPIFEASCVQCHARGKSKGAFSLETRDDFLAGGDTGAPAIAGHSAESLVVEMISGLDSEKVMPKKGKKLTHDQVALFRAWVDQGMIWPADITFPKHAPANLRPSELTPPTPKSGLESPIDGFIDLYFSKNRQAWGRVVDDRGYARRVWLDTIGLLPPPDELAAFLADRSPDKRARLVDRLLSENQPYAEHWLTFWNDLLRNDYRGTGFIDGGRKQITNWIYAALARNLRYDQFVAELLRPGAETDGFTNGIAWRGAVNASMVPPMQAAQSVAQVFLGVNLKCASCHDSFINEYTLEDSYGLASVYTNSPLEIAECDRPTGHKARAKFLYEELGSIDVKSGPDARKQQLVEIITGRKHGRLPRTIVNRLWQRFLGVGLVEPVDEMDKPAWSPALLDWLAEDLVAHDYDLKQTMKRILTSRAYQLEAVNVGEITESYVFRGPAIRRLSAEQFTDAVTGLGGLSYPKLAGKLNRTSALDPAPALSLAPKWIWGVAGADTQAKPAAFKFQRTITFASAPTAAHLAICADDNYSLKINGKAVAASGKRNSTSIDWIDLTSRFQVGDNLIEVTAENMPPDEGRLVSVKTDALPELDSPAGLILCLQTKIGETVTNVVSDSSWSVVPAPVTPPTTGLPPTPTPKSETPPALVGTPAIELGGVDLAPWRLGSRFLELANAPADQLPVQRASLVAATPLMTALGRPNREQIVTVRQDTATTLQALELTNGAALAQLLQEVADKILATSASGPDLVNHLYLKTLSRSPTAAERTLAEKVVGSPARNEGVQDLVWMLAMLPEFQLIR